MTILLTADLIILDALNGRDLAEQFDHQWPLDWPQYVSIIELIEERN